MLRQSLSQSHLVAVGVQADVCGELGADPQIVSDVNRCLLETATLRPLNSEPLSRERLLCVRNNAALIGILL